MKNASVPSRLEETPEHEATMPDTEPAAPALVPPATRADDGSEAPPPPAVTGRGPMDQSVPDVATGSTPLTRRDD